MMNSYLQKLLAILTMSALLFMSTGVMAGSTPVFVSTDWLAKHINDKDVIIVDMTMGGMQYNRFHIPGAIRLDYGEIVKRRRDRVSVRLSNDELARVLGGAGISADSYVVIYDDMGGLNAGRLFWEMERIGHKKVSVVQGGLVTWILEYRKVTNKPTVRKPVTHKKFTAGRNNEAMMLDVVKASNDKQVTLLDVRTDMEYVGNPRMPRTGHVPGALWWPWMDNVAFEKGFILVEEDKINQSLARLGVKDKKQPVIVYCKSGHRAAQAYLTLRSLGYENVKLYDGSMDEYARVRTNPLVMGKQPN
ncbi:MAG: rhodanese-like domain-containing protein [Gammaproteobacteria bacterium]|nr:MAG: rhodanese-like domain-containing protein [Gammaproteobacteria bacterium]